MQVEKAQGRRQARSPYSDDDDDDDSMTSPLASGYTAKYVHSNHELDFPQP